MEKSFRPLPPGLKTIFSFPDHFQQVADHAPGGMGIAEKKGKILSSKKRLPFMKRIHAKIFLITLIVSTIILSGLHVTIAVH